MSYLKPFVIDATDIHFILDQVKFRPLFDADGNAIILWNGMGAIYDGQHNLIWDGTFVPSSVTIGIHNAGEAIATYGTSYQTLVDLAGLRDVAGFNNNLSKINADWGSVDQIFTRSAAADYAHYSPTVQAVAAAAYAAAKEYYGKYSDGSAYDGSPTGKFNLNGSLNTNYAVTLDTTAGVQPGDTLASDGTPINLKNVVDYTPRMISQLTTTAGVQYDTWANHQSDPAAASHGAGEIYYDSQGLATVTDWGLLETVAKGGLGQVDTQARLAASAGQNDHFIGGLNPGVSPSNGLFVLFGQFFDHGLDFIGKASGATIKIALATDDPLYGMLGPDGQPVHEITISRATVQTVDANGPEYVNHTSPFIDQSQTYGSHAQLTTLLREWVKDPISGLYHAGMKLFDGQTLAAAWTRADGTSTHDTLPTLDELRAHVVATGRDALTWEDVNDLRNRDASGHVTSGTSGSALLLDMNPRFDAGHMGGFYDTNGDGVQGAGEASYGTAAQAALVTAAISALDADVKLKFGSGSSFKIDDTTHKLTLFMETLPPGTPNGTPHTLSGASALYPYVNFADFSITVPAGTVHDAVGEILMASVGDHYIAGDGRVNENFGLTSIHHVFHEEHNYQIDNLIEALHRQDIVSGDPTHAALHGFQVDTGHTNTAGDFVNADLSIAWDQDKMFNASKLIVEMEYQHAAVDQYARNVSPNIQEFGAYATSVNSAISLEYAQAAFRFGHSTLRETIDTIDPSHGLTGKIMGYALKEAFLSPEKFADVGASAIILGMSHQQMNEVDEFVTPALTQGLLGQPLDLAAINIARGRDVGLPTLNDFRLAIGLAKYTSWTDFGQNMQHPTSLANFIAAYSFDGDLDKANAIMGLVDGTVTEGTAAAMGFSITDAYTFVNGGDQGFNHIDTWLGGLAEVHQPGGLLGETFDKVFVDQIEQLMDGDRFYYLYRLFGTQFGNEVSNGQLKDIVERNTGLTHLNGNIFGYADQYVDLGAHKEVLADGQTEYLTTGNEHKYGDVATVIGDVHVSVDDGSIGVYSNGGRGNANDGHVVTINGIHYIQDTRLADTHQDSAYGQNDFVNLDGTPNSGSESNEIIVGTKGADLIYGGGGDDTVYGDGGDDIIYGGYGIDRLYGGDGSDHIYGGDNPDLIDGGSGDDFLYGESSGSDINGQDQVIGGSGNDYISGGIGIDKLLGGTGDDVIYGNQDTDPNTHGDDGNDWIDGGSGTDVLYGDNGDDLIRDGTDVDISFGGNGDDIFQVGDIAQALGAGPDEVIGGDGITDEGNKPGTIGFDIMDFSLQTKRIVGVTYDLDQQANPLTSINGQQTVPAAYQIEGLVGSQSDDKLDGDAGANWIIGGSGNDVLSGDAGNDVIVGGSIRLDALIGHYVDANGNTSTYDHNNGNDGSTEELRIQDARYDGASHRVGYTDTLTQGLLGSTGFDKHFTEMLRSQMFKDLVLGDGGADGGSDTVAYTGAMAKYTLVAVDANGVVVTNPHMNWTSVAAVKVTDNRTAADLVDANGAPLTGAGGSPLVNEGTDLVIGVQKFAFADGIVDIQAYFDKAPTLDLDYKAGPISIASDNLNGNSAYGNGTGWTSAWIETGDITGGGRNFDPATTGAIQHGGARGTGYLQFVQSTGAGADGAAIARSVDLSGHASPTLSFDLTKNGIGAGETLSLQYSADGGVSFTTLRTYGDGTGGTVAATGTQTVDLSAQPLSADAVIRFAVNRLGGASDYFRIDNVSISETGDTHPGNDFATTYIERGTAVSIAATASITDPDDLTNASARIVLRDGIAGDQLNLGALTGGIVASKVSATEIDLTGVASHAAYQAAIAAITFSDPNNHDPTAVDRHVDVTVNDGLKDSAVATTTVHVTPVNDAPVAGADHVITNVANNTAFALADWVLLANDTDYDNSTLRITGVAPGTSVSLTATHGNGATATTVTDTGTPAGGTFDYTLNDGSGTATATAAGHVVVDRVTSNVVTGGAANDLIVLAVNAVQDKIDGAGGTNTVDYSAYSAALTVDFTAATTQVLGSGATAATADTLTNIQNLIGGGGNDKIIAAVDNVCNAFDGGGGTDTIDFSHYTTGLSVDLRAASANAAGFSTVVGSGADAAHSDLVKGFESIVGGSGGDSVTVGSGTTTFTGNAGHDTMAFSTGTLQTGPARDVFTDFVTHAGATVPLSADQIDLTALGQMNVGHAGAAFLWNGVGQEFLSGRNSPAEIRYHVEGTGGNAHTILDYHAAGGGTTATGQIDLGVGIKTLLASGPTVDSLHADILHA